VYALCVCASLRVLGCAYVCVHLHVYVCDTSSISVYNKFVCTCSLLCVCVCVHDECADDSSLAVFVCVVVLCATDLIHACHVRQHFMLVTFVILHNAVMTDGHLTGHAIEVQLLVVFFACADLLGNGLFALCELFDGLKGVVHADLSLAVVPGALLTHELAALRAVVSGLIFLVALLAHEIGLPRHALRFFDQIPHNKVDVQLLRGHGADLTARRAGELRSFLFFPIHAALAAKRMGTAAQNAGRAWPVLLELTSAQGAAHCLDWHDCSGPAASHDA